MTPHVAGVAIGTWPPPLGFGILVSRPSPPREKTAVVLISLQFVRHAAVRRTTLAASEPTDASA